MRRKNRKQKRQRREIRREQCSEIKGRRESKAGEKEQKMTKTR